MKKELIKALPGAACLAALWIILFIIPQLIF
jgi:hypothetical protein